LSISNEKVKLDEVLKFLLSTSKKVLVNLLNGIFQENYSSDEVKLSISNNEFVMDTFDILRGDVFFDILNSEVEYLNRNYFNDENLEEEVITMTKTLYDPEVEKKGEKKKAIEIAKNLLDILDNETIALKTGLAIDEVSKLRTGSESKDSK
jgi:hypothetical protein